MNRKAPDWNKMVSKSDKRFVIRIYTEPPQLNYFKKVNPVKRRSNQTFIKDNIQTKKCSTLLVMKK